MSIEESFKPLSKLVRPFWRTWINSRISRNCLDHFTKWLDHFERQQVISLNRLNRLSYWNFSLVLCVSVVSWYFYVILGLFLVLWIYKLVLCKLKFIWQIIFTRSWSLKLKTIITSRLLFEVENCYYITSYTYLAPLMISLNDSIILKHI